MNFTPAIYEHAAKLIGVTPWQASRDRELLVKGHAAAYRRYRHTPIVGGIDIYNLEAEACGATIINKPSLQDLCYLLSSQPVDDTWTSEAQSP